MEGFFFSQNRRIGPGHPHPTSNYQSSTDETPTTMRTLARLSTSYDHQSSLADAQLAAGQICGFVVDCQCMATRKSGCFCEASIPASLLRYQCKLAEGTKRLGYISPQYDKASVTSFENTQRREYKPQIPHLHQTPQSLLSAIYTQPVLHSEVVGTVVGGSSLLEVGS